MTAVGFVDVVAEVLEVEPAELADDAGPGTVANWTSLRHVQLVVALEETYGVALTPDEIRSLRSIGDIRAVLAGHGIQVERPAVGERA